MKFMILNGPFAARAPIVPQLFRKEKQGLDSVTDTTSILTVHTRVFNLEYLSQNNISDK